MRETLAEEKLLDEFTRSGSVVLHRESVEEKLQGKYGICKPGKSAHRFDPVSPAACKRMPLRFRQADRGTGPFKVWTNKKRNKPTVRLNLKNHGKK